MTGSASRGASPTDTTHSPAATWRTLEGGAVTIEGGLWARRQAINRDAALPHGYRMLETAGNFENLRIAGGRSTGRYQGPVFMDSDVYKWIEAAAYEHARVPSEWLLSHMATAIDIVGGAQGADGYLNSHYTVAEPERRWTDFAQGHELYCAGHLFQAAVAHHRATGTDGLLGSRAASPTTSATASAPGSTRGRPATPRSRWGWSSSSARPATGATSSSRGSSSISAAMPGSAPDGTTARPTTRTASRSATRRSSRATPSARCTSPPASRTSYLETGEAALLGALHRQWADIVSRKLYVTGGVGSRHLGEAFGQPYELPNDLAYDETCAAIASILWSWRMLLATGQGRFADLIDRTLHNAVLSGVSLDGERYFYVNPLASNGRAEYLGRGGCVRKEWHLVACCPPNVMRLLASFGHYVATRDRTGLQVHQYAPARIVTALAEGGAVRLRMETRYPWEGAVRLTVEESDGRSWSLALRVPEWCAGRAALRVNGGAVPATHDGRGYLHLERSWRAGDTVELDLPMDARLIEPHPAIEATRGCLAIERGPLVYCVEQADQGDAPVAELEIDPSRAIESRWTPELLEGVVVVRAPGFRADTSAWDDRLYRPFRPGTVTPVRQRAELTAIPYFAWANRGPGAMRVWIPQATTP